MGIAHCRRILGVAFDISDLIPAGPTLSVRLYLVAESGNAQNSKLIEKIHCL